jgi:hypothetical protein
VQHWSQEELLELGLALVLVSPEQVPDSPASSALPEKQGSPELE